MRAEGLSEPLPSSVSPQPKPASWLTRWGFVLTVGMLTLASLVLLAASSIPLGIPGEWTWARRDLGEIDPLTVLQGLLLAAGYWGVVRWGATASPRPVLLCLLAFGWLYGLLFVSPEFQGLGRSPTVLYYKRTEGYFWQAAFEVQDSRAFLHSYRNSISTGDDPDRYLHLGTHPPGLTLAYRGLLSVMESSPKLTEALIAIEPPAMHEAFDSLRQFPTPRHQALTLVEEATLWAATLLTLLATAGACWPIYRLTARMSDPLTAWRAAALWPLVPSLLVFFPKSDLLCPVIATTSCWLWLDGWSRQCWGRCVLAGVGFFCGLMLTLALAPIALLLTIQTVLERWTRREEFRDRPARADALCVLAAVAGLALPLAVLAWWGSCHPLAIWMQNLQNHGMFYDHNSRSYLGWLAVNPLEAAFALGLPIACLVGMGMKRIPFDRSPGPREPRKAPSIAFSQTLAWFGVWAFLWLSGKNMGEAARLWIFLAPWPVMTAAIALSPKHHVSAESDSLVAKSSLLSDGGCWELLLALQLVACVLTATTVDGFHFAELLPK